LATRSQSAFQTVKAEGALLPADLLKRVADGDKEIEGLSPESYHLDPADKINEATNRAWIACRDAWQRFQKQRAELPEADKGTTLTRERWLLVLFRELGYGRLQTAKAFEIEGKTYALSHGWGASPIHLISFRYDLDTTSHGVFRTSPHSLVQELLNRSDDHLWAFVSNGLQLRILRDNVSFTRPAFVEFDLEAMLEGEVYSDFLLLWLLSHQSRVESEIPEQCWLEKWHQTAKKQGTRVLDRLRDGVERSIEAFGQGFLAHRGNGALRQKLADGKLTTQDYYQQLLRLVYRLIFLFVAEDRDLLLTPDADATTRKRFERNYSLTRIRRLAQRRRGTRHSDLWQGVKVVFKSLHKGETCLGLPALGSMLFSDRTMPDLDECELANDRMLEAVRHLAFTVERNVLRQVDYKNLGSEELGSVYESLLELHPDVNADAATFELTSVAGSERKTTGSYYTPSSLINCLLDSALDPVVEEALKKPDREKAILDLKVCDPACGSGHFLIAAANRLSHHLATARTGDEEPSPASAMALRSLLDTRWRILPHRMSASRTIGGQCGDSVMFSSTAVWYSHTSRPSASNLHLAHLHRRQPLASSAPAGAIVRNRWQCTHSNQSGPHASMRSIARCQPPPTLRNCAATRSLCSSLHSGMCPPPVPSPSPVRRAAHRRSGEGQHQGRSRRQWTGQCPQFL